MNNKSFGDKAASAINKAGDSVGKAVDTVSDTTLTASIKTKLYTSTDVADADISVKTNDGVVTLFGMVESIQQKDAAEGITRTIDGVLNVTNVLAVSPN